MIVWICGGVGILIVAGLVLFIWALLTAPSAADHENELDNYDYENPCY